MEPREQQVLTDGPHYCYYRHTPFVAIPLTVLCRILFFFFYKLKVCGNPELSGDA